MVGAMTVKENITFSANLRLPYALSPEEKQKRVADTISVLGLTKCQDTYVGTPFIRGASLAAVCVFFSPCISAPLSPRRVTNICSVQTGVE